MTNRRLYKPLIVLLSLILIFNTTGYALVAGENTVTASVSWEQKIDPLSAHQNGGEHRG